MDGWMGRSVDGRMVDDGWKDGWMDACMHAWMDGWIDGCGWVGRWTGGKINGWTIFSRYFLELKRGKG